MKHPIFGLVFKASLTLILCFLSVSLKGQQTPRDVVNPITKTRIIIFKTTKANSPYHKNIHKLQLNARYPFVFLTTAIEIDSTGGISSFLDILTRDLDDEPFTGNKVVFLLDSGQTIEFEKESQDYYYSSTKHRYPLKKDDLIALSSNNIKGIRVYKEKEDFQISMPKKIPALIRQTFESTLTELKKVSK